MSAPRRTEPVGPQPLLHVRQVAAVRAALAPHVQPLDHLVADAAQRVLRRVAAVAQPAGALQRLAALAAVRVDARRLLVQLVY